MKTKTKTKNSLFILLIVIFTISFADGKIITTPSEYYDLIKFDNYQQFPNREPNEHHQQNDFYYPDICSNATRNNMNGTILFSTRFFPGPEDTYRNFYITKGATMTIIRNIDTSEDMVNILCIEGSLEIEPSLFDIPFIVSAIIILPGGSLKSKRPIVVRDFYEPHSLIDPLGFFPGILSLNGNLTISSTYKIIYPATRLNNTLLSVPGLIEIPANAYIISELFPLGVKITTSITNEQLKINEAEISEDDENINVVLYKESPYPVSTTSGSSIYITANSNVHIENYYIGSYGKTSNQEYNNTVLVFDPTDSNIVTDIIMGTNQRFRSSLFIENSNNVNIINSVIYETNETRSPIVISGSKLNIQGSIIASKSGSSIIAQYGTEYIKSSNNLFYLSKASSRSGTNQIQSSAAYMNYGFESNGIYSLSPNIISTSDTFIGHSNAFNFNFISNRSSVTGYNYDCFAPCTSSSVLVSSLSQFPVDLIISAPSVPNKQLDQLLLNINNNGNQVTRYFTINGLSLSDSIKLNLNNSVLTLSNVKVNDHFNIQGTVGKLNIVNSTISSIASNSQFSNSTVISNSYIRGEFGPNVEFKGSSYHYDIENLGEDLPIESTFPTDKYQILVNTTVNIMVQLGASTFNDNGIKCELGSIGSSNIISSIPIDLQMKI